MLGHDRARRAPLFFANQICPDVKHAITDLLTPTVVPGQVSSLGWPAECQATLGLGLLWA